MTRYNIKLKRLSKQSQNTKHHQYPKHLNSTPSSPKHFAPDPLIIGGHQQLSWQDVTPLLHLCGRRWWARREIVIRSWQNFLYFHLTLYNCSITVSEWPPWNGGSSPIGQFLSLGIIDGWPPLYLLASSWRTFAHLALDSWTFPERVHLPVWNWEARHWYVLRGDQGGCGALSRDRYYTNPHNDTPFHKLAISRLVDSLDFVFYLLLWVWHRGWCCIFLGWSTKS